MSNTFDDTAELLNATTKFFVKGLAISLDSVEYNVLTTLLAYELANMQANVGRFMGGVQKAADPLSMDEELKKFFKPRDQ